jgi:hypothetical protein
MNIQTPLRITYYITLIISLLFTTSHASLFGPTITIHHADSLSTQENKQIITFAIADSTGVASYTLFLNNKDCTSRLKVLGETKGRYTIRLSFTAALREGLNTVVISAANTENRRNSRTVMINREKSTSWINYRILRKALFHLLKRLF